MNMKKSLKREKCLGLVNKCIALKELNLLRLHPQL